jgi:hypothetical protein
MSNMLTEVELKLKQLEYIAKILLSEHNALTDEQAYYIQTVVKNSQRLLGLTPSLEKLLHTMNRKQAIRQMSTEWRTPFASIMGYTKLLSEGHVGALSSRQVMQLQLIHASAKELMEWSNADGDPI